jgi:hypothetical protein
MGDNTQLFGQVAVRKGFVTPQQVDASLSLQTDLRRQGKPHKLIGMIMLEAGYLDTTQLIDILKSIEQARTPAS